MPDIQIPTHFVTKGGREGTARKCSVCGHVGELVVKHTFYIQGVAPNKYYVCSKCGVAFGWRWEKTE